MNRISIITATYNSAATLRDTLESVRRQNYPGEIEHLIQDGGSTDETLAIAADYPELHIQSVPDRGIYDAMNRGLGRATGSIVGILNSDDFFATDEVLDRVMTLFEAPGVRAVYGDLEYVDATDTSRVLRRWWAGSYQRDNWKYGWMPPHPTFFVRRELYHRYGMFNTKLRSAADYELMLRFCYKNGVAPVYLPLTMVKMRAGGVSNASLRNRLRANQEDRLAWELNGLSCPPYTTLLKPMRKIPQWLRGRFSG